VDGEENSAVSGPAVFAGRVNESRMAMAKTAVVSAQPGFVEQVKGLPERIKSFYGDIRSEMRKVTTPAPKEVKATTIVVIVTVIIFGVYFWVIDGVIGHSLDSIFRYFSTH
jgi:preprotein translocase subunit SecE